MKHLQYLFTTTLMLAIWSCSLMAQDLNHADLVGKWKLTKIVVKEMQGGDILSEKEFSPENYSGEVPFKMFEGFSNGTVLYVNKGGESVKGNIQFQNNAGYLYFHKFDGTFSCKLSWLEKGKGFTLESSELLSQELNRSNLVILTYIKQ